MPGDTDADAAEVKVFPCGMFLKRTDQDLHQRCGVTAFGALQQDGILRQYVAPGAEQGSGDLCSPGINTDITIIPHA
ncbi:MAG: hypothetical protein U5N26_07275 [Candidatus Marinimicrobia bacterium]|nr:hypothetical protein [Candidatus Neomarinimicrobiota bacterium]